MAIQEDPKMSMNQCTASAEVPRQPRYQDLLNALSNVESVASHIASLMATLGIPLPETNEITDSCKGGDSLASVLRETPEKTHIICLDMHSMLEAIEAELN